MPRKQRFDTATRNGQTTSQSANVAIPHWHSELRTLYLGNELVKHFRRASPDVQRILDALEAHRWAPFIDNPLPRVPGRNNKRHLHNVIQNFNRCLDRTLLKLRNRGDQVGWEII